MNIPADFFTWALLSAMALTAFITHHFARKSALGQGYDRGYGSGYLAGRRTEREDTEQARHYSWLAHHSRVLLRQAVAAGAKGHQVRICVNEQGYATKTLIVMAPITDADLTHERQATR